VNQKILIIQLRQLGDILLTTPVLPALKKRFPHSEISFLTHPMGRMILTGNPYLSELILHPTDQGIRCHLQFLKELRRRRFDTVIDFMNNPRSALYTLWSGAESRIAFKSRRTFAYNRLVEKPASSSYIVDEKFKLLEPLGSTPDQRRLILPWGEQKEGEVVARLAQQQPQFAEVQGLRIILSPTHRREPRQWPKAQYAKLADWLVQKWGAQVLWAWGPGEESFIDETMALAQTQTWKIPPTSFRELAAFIANSDLFIGNSNGPSHVAVAVGTSSLQLHGPTKMKSWCPLTPVHRGIQATDGHDIAKITLDEVIQVLDEMHPMLLARMEKRHQEGFWLHWLQKPEEMYAF
jgi:ADP-heptose:LPS heptosyltransferase